MKSLKNFFFKAKLSKEAFEAYFYRLPGSIEVVWHRDGEYIIGDIKTDDKEFMTQGIGAEDFIGMVNDTVYAMYDIPEEYIDSIKSYITYNPPMEQKRLLENTAISNSIIKAVKDAKVLEVA